MDYNLQKFFLYSLDLLCIAGIDGHFKLVNPSFERTLGWSEEELLSKPFIEFVHPDDVISTLLEVDKLSQGQPTVSFENRYKCKDGEYRNLLWAAYPELETGLLYSVARDVTERRVIERQREKKLESAIENLEKLQKLLPICSYCKNIRNDDGYWRNLEIFLSDNTDLQLTHSVCPSCKDKHFGDYLSLKKLL